MNGITNNIIGAAIKVHKTLGPGLLESAYDLLVDELVIAEIKAVEHLLPIHEAQLMSYLKLSGCKVGLLINFNVTILKNGIHRIANNFPD